MTKAVVLRIPYFIVQWLKDSEWEFTFFECRHEKTCSQSSSCDHLFNGEAVFQPQHATVVNPVCQNQTPTQSLRLSSRPGGWGKLASSRKGLWQKSMDEGVAIATTRVPGNLGVPADFGVCCNVLHQVDESDCCRGACQRAEVLTLWCDIPISQSRLAL